MQNEVKYYNVGGVVFALDMPDFEEKIHLSDFRCRLNAPEEADVRYTVSLADDPVLPDGEILYSDEFRRYIRTEDGVVRAFIDERDRGVLMTDTAVGNEHRILYNSAHTDYFSASLAMKLMNIPRYIIGFGGIFLHASFIDVGGEAVLFTARTQVGKSTQAALWEKYRGAEVINGDRALLRKNGGRWYAWGSPYCGTSDICLNRSLPVKAIVILSQGNENKAGRAGAGRSFAALLDGCSFDTWDREQMKSVTQICGDIAADVRFFTLECRPDEGAVEALEELL